MSLALYHVLEPALARAVWHSDWSWKVRRTLFALTAALLLGACDSGDPEGPGSLSILLTDAPGDVEQAIVTIERIEIVGGSGGPRVLRDTPWTGDLALLTNEFVTLVDGYVLPQGSYAQLRFVISEACISVEADGGPNEVYASTAAFAPQCDGTLTGDLQMPSFSQTGIKVIFQGAISVDSDQTIVLIDFDVEESFGKLAGGSGQWVMDPTIHGVEITFSGTVNLTVELASGVTLPDPPTFVDFTASLSGEDLALESDGTASFLYVVPGPYQLDLDPPTGWTITTTPTPLPLDLTLESGEVENVTITLESLTEVP